MTKPADVMVFHRKCPHGVSMTEKRRFSGPVYCEADKCDACRAEVEAQEAQADAEIDAMCERIRARKSEER